MQSLWRFPLSSKHHIHQFYIEKCLCPKIDNWDRIGSGYFIYNKGCPYHGAMLKQNEKECTNGEYDYMRVTNNNIKIKCSTKELYNLLIQDIKVEAIGSGFVVTLITDPPNAALLYYTRNNLMHITSYTEEFVHCRVSCKCS